MQEQQILSEIGRIQMRNILRDLIALPSITGDYTSNNQAIDYIDTFLSDRGMLVKRLEFNGVESLIATTHDTKTPEIFLQAHVDVSPAPAELFTLTEDSEKFYGRGVFDMKFAIAAYLQLVEDLRYCLSDYDFGIMIVTDEEVGGFDGAQRLVEAGYIPKKACVIPDGGDNWAIETFAKGIFFAKLTMPGKAAHGSRPWEGDSALERLFVLLDELRTLFPDQGQTTNTMTIGTLHAGEVANQMPAEATAELDVRTMSLAKHEELKSAIAAICKTHGAACEVKAEGIPCINDIHNPYINQFAESIKAVIGRDSGTTISFAGTDGRHFTAVNVPCVIVRPPGGGHHSADEWIAKDGFYQLREVLVKYVNALAKTPAKELLHAAAA